MQKNKIVLILLAFLLATPLTVNSEIFSEPLENPAREEAVVPETSEAVEPATPAVTLDEDQLDHNSYTFKQPTSKKKMAKKFLLAMGAVAVSSLILFVMLSLYNKLREGFKYGISNSSQENEGSLETPDTLSGAVRVFLDKTHWN